jgi:alkanesulfonate monooxygenase SsuD/methylene tetrahydromethanopterin reductase-like flavin-dependent oxidoreductase (luciferase family)
MSKNDDDDNDDEPDDDADADADADANDNVDDDTYDTLSAFLPMVRRLWAEQTSQEYGSEIFHYSVPNSDNNSNVMPPLPQPQQQHYSLAFVGI